MDYSIRAEESVVRALPERRVAALLAALLAAVLPISGVQADAPGGPAGPDIEELLEIPFSLNDDPLAHDPGFNGGSYFADAFAGPSSNYYLGRKLVRLANGDVIVAGLVPQVGGTNVPGRFHLGLVRYNSAGQRVAWTAPGQYGHFGNQYIVYPNTANPEITDVIDIVASETSQDRIYVLVNLAFGQEGNVAVVRFTQQGAPLGTTVPFSTSALETGAGLVHYSLGFGGTGGYKLAVIGTRFETTKGRPVYRRYDVTAGGIVAETGMQDIHPTNGDCSVNIQSGGCIATAVTSVTWSAFESLPPRIYVAGVTTSNLNPEANDFFVTRIIGGSGAGVGYWDSSFGTGGTRTVAFDVPGGNLRDYATGVAARRGGPDPAQPLGNNTGDEVYVVGQVAQQCTPGVGIAAFNHNGTAAAFGPLGNGKQLFGGQNVPCNQVLYESADFANAVIYDNDRLVIVGFSAYERICLPPGSVCEDNVDPMIAIVRGRDGWVQEHRDFRVQPAQRVRHGGLYDVVAGNGGYTVTGDDRYFNTDPNFPGRQEFTTARFRMDRIFGNGYNCGGGYPDYNPPGCPN